ncbi:MAG: Hypothetical protein ywlG [Brockia lithotrophica]|uniref:UPF0340 protein BLITH_0423 n=1 Tax=Brockia lithotrophica TaxID=933949 RepID=A0A2T5GAY4_9BACL|nr:TIGR01440 family protein [Brockia lithotrophica]PTQ53343.1 MAG: Hypothetical protein ywlG [Brockia lithotrophica]
MEGERHGGGIEEAAEAFRMDLAYLNERFPLTSQHLLVVGLSTSEVVGLPIGKGSNLAVARALFEVLDAFRRDTGVHVAVQCCEHLNRALVVRPETVERFALEPVLVRPVPEAGGAFATVAYEAWGGTCVEAVRAHAGIDVGATLIGMHLKPVAVPVRPPRPFVGQAFVTMAVTRPRLIGGPRARYPEYRR